MVFTNAINNQIPNSVLVPEGFNTFNRSQQRQAEIQAATEEEFAPIAALTSGFLSGGTLVAPLLDTALMSARGLGKAASIIPGLGPEFAKGVERTIPEPFVQKALENAILFGQRKDIARTAGELPFMLGELGGAITSGAGLAKAIPQVGSLFGTAFDIASGTPGATGFLAGAKTAGQAIGRGAAIGAAGSILPAIDVAYNAQQGIIDPMAGLGTLGFGTALGAAVPAVPIATARGKQALDDITQTVRKRIANSDAVRTMQDITKRRFEAQQAQQMAVQKQMEQMPFENPLASETAYSGLGVGEQTIAPRTLEQPLQPFERQGVPEPLQPNRFNYDAEGRPILKTRSDTFADEVTLDKNISAETYTKDVTQMEKDLDYVAKEIGNLRKKEITLTKDEYQQEKALYKQVRDKEKEYGLSDGTIKLSSDTNVTQLLKQYEEIQTLQKQADEFRTSRIAEREQARANDLTALEKLGDELLTRYDETTARYKQEQEYLGGLQQMAAQEESRYLPVLSRQEPQANLEAGTSFRIEPSAMREERIYGPRPTQENALVTYREPFKTEIEAPKEGIIVEEPVSMKAGKKPIAEEGIVIGTAKPIPVEEKLMYNRKAKLNRFSPVTNQISRLSKKTGAAFNNYAVRGGIYQNEFLNQLKPLVDVVKKYAKDPTVMKNLGNVNRVGYEALPQDLARALEAAQPVFRTQAEALNKKGMDINLTDEIYFPRGWNDIDQLQMRLGSTPEKASEYQKAPINIKNRMLSRELEKSKTIPEVTDDIVDLFDPMQGITNWIENTAEKKAEVDLFGNATGKLEENVSNLLLENKDDFKSPQDIQKAMDTMLEAFKSQTLDAGTSYKVYSAAASTMIFTGQTTALSQLNDVFLSMARNGSLETLSGITQTITSLFPGYKGPMKDILKRTGMSESVAAYTDTGQLDKFADLFSLLNKKQYKEAALGAAQNIGLAANKGTYILTRLADAFGKKVNLIGRHERLKSNPGLVQNDVAEFQPDPQKQQEIFNYYKDLKDNYKTAKYKSMPSDVLAYLTNSALKYHAKTQYDRSLGAITGDFFERSANFTMSFANKFAATAKDDFAKLSQEVITSKNPAKTAKKLLEVGAGLATVVGGGIALSLIKGGYTLNDEGLPITPEAITKTGTQFVTGTVMPWETRLVQGAMNIKKAEQPSDYMMALGNLASPSIGTSAAAVGTALKLGLEGRPQDIYNMDINPYGRYMPPRVATEYAYRQSDKFQQDIAKKKVRSVSEPIIEQKTLDDLNARKYKVLQYEPLLRKEDVKLLREAPPDTTAYKTALRNAEQTVTDLRQVGTTDPGTVANAQTQKLLADAQFTRKEAIARDLLKQGVLTKEQFIAVMLKYKQEKKAYNIR